MQEEKKTVKLTEPQLVNAFNSERANLEGLQEQYSRTENYLQELLAARDALAAIQKAKDNEKIVVPLGAGVYIDAAIENKNTVKASFGSGVVMPTSIDEALKELEGRKTDTEKAVAGLQRDREQMLSNLNSLGKLLNTIEQNKKKSQ